MSGLEIVTHGCRLNIAESEAIRAALGGSPDLVIVNSCTVTAEAAASARKAIRRAARERPGVRIVVTGCASEIDRAGFAAMPEVERVVPNAAKLDPAGYGVPPAAADRPADAGLETHTRAFLPVQNGCDHRCTFCIIPYGRGPSRSVAIGEAVVAARRHVAAGRREIVLTGVDLTAYGGDLPDRPTLAALVVALLAELPELGRLRLSSLDPCEVDAGLYDLLAHEPRVMPHVHLSLQAGDDMVLKRMKRRHTRTQAVDLVARLKAARPEIAIGADLIAGFPTESEAMFGRTLALIEECDIVLPHVFPYSPRAGTPAARMPQVTPATVRERAARLRAAGDVTRRRWLARQVGRTVSVLVERDGRHGHAEDFAQIALARPAPPRAIVDVRVAATDGARLIGEAA